jgi:soluble lytic murein transglycosylase-like protein
LATSLPGGCNKPGHQAFNRRIPSAPQRPNHPMKRPISFVWLAAMAMLSFSQIALAQHAEIDALVASHAKANAVPEALVHRVIVRESRYRAHLVGHGGTIGLMQIKLATARGLGYAGDAEGLRDPDTNLAYGIKYLAGAYRAANGDHDRAMHYYASGYYEVAKRARFERVVVGGLEPSGNPASPFVRAARKSTIKNVADARAQQVPAPRSGANAAKAR